MVIEFTNEFIDTLINSSSEDEKIRGWSLINDALHSVLHYHHIVYTTIQSIDILLKHGKTDNSNKHILRWMKNYIQNLNSIKNKVQIIIEPTFNISCIKDKADNSKPTKFVINIMDLDEFKESVLISENATDFEFYKYIYHWFNGNSFYDLSISNIPSNGANADAIIISCNQEKKFSLCIVDSDKDFEKGPFGNTYHNAADGDRKRANQNIPFHLHPLKVREKENLFPFNEYLKVENMEKKTQKLVSLLASEQNQELLRYYDMKDGIKKKKMNSKKLDARWGTLYMPFIEKCKVKGLCEEDNPCVDCEIESCKGCKNEDSKYIWGIGDKLLAAASEDFFKRYPKKINNMTEIDNIFNNQKFIIDMWDEIAKLLFSFGCSISRSIKFIS